MPQCSQRVFVFFLITRDRYINPSISHVGRDTNISNRHHSESRIFKLVPDNLRDFLAQSIRHSLRSMHHSKSVGRSSAQEQQKQCPPAPACCSCSCSKVPSPRRARRYTLLSDR